MFDLEALHRQIRDLDSGDDTKRRQAIHSLMDIDEQDWAAAPAQIVQTLVEALNQQFPVEPARVGACREIVLLLGKIGPRSKPALSNLTELLNEKNPEAIRETVVVTLGKIGRAAGSTVDQLIDLLSSCRPAVVVQIVRSIGNIAHVDNRVRMTLVGLWQSPTQAQMIQAEAGITLCKLGIGVPGLVASLTRVVVAHQETGIRQSAAMALAWCGSEEIDVVPGLLRAAQSDKNEDVRQTAEAGLAKLGLSRKQAIRICSKQLSKSVHAEAALRLSGELAVGALVSVLTEGDPTTSDKAARILGSLGDLSLPAVPGLRQALQSTHPESRLAAVKSLWMITKDAGLVTPVLVGLLREKRRTEPEDAESRRRFLQTVMEALRRIGPGAEEAIPALLEKSKDKNRLISESALGALKEISPGCAK
jgi:HEAT repeat protein